MIRKYETGDELLIMELIESEGEEWSSYCLGDGRTRYLESLIDSITYVKVKNEKIIGYIRAIDDHGFEIYICDLLVSKMERGNQYGFDLISLILSMNPHRDIYVMSDVDPYYLKQGYKKIGSIFKIE